ncbi:hypothetical protein BX616_004372 [Lobosporangium transversale]|uniref:PWWP domain-containing protein n=1 Tax=Lobosporangium transversale TaxID=64571 RepID=A0A1Y2GGW3_9FUNG|nr:hypothetical protein BCR41DRAFT_423753 [Lobosporangium transversale]KAF9898189.1 hypothetical protein BX616_004372 [Lobosporangium transversale]ORZ10614.1 hypothetical protein BCR41DRAFT_423753 [Lobosporangium transversale]|eukprot:XP_021879335.1 hypothetical protein BCR41DRAFT_423753 [Lobosporangium transversale]
MTRAASNRKQSAGSASTSTRPGPVFRGRDVVFVDPLDDKESYWWPAMIVPVPEIDSSMDCTVLNPGECLVKYFEDNKYSVVPFTDLQPFVPTTIPFLEFELAAGQKFLKNGGVVNAMAYLESGKVKRKFSWYRWGTAQDQELSLDMLKHNKPISLPLVTDEAFNDMQQTMQRGPSSGISSSEASSPTTSAKNFTDSENDSPRTSSSSISSSISAIISNGGNLKNGLQRSNAGATSQLIEGLLPSPVSLNDLPTESMDETEFSPRSTRAKVDGTLKKDNPITPSPSRSRSRRGSRDTDSKASVASTEKETMNKRSRNVSEQSFSSSSPNSNTTTVPPTSIPGMAASSETSTHGAAHKKRKMTGGPSVLIYPQNTTQDGVTSASNRSSRQGSAEPSPSPRSTRHSSRNSKSSDPGQQSQSPNSEELVESPQEATGPVRLQTQRMTRQRSTPKSAMGVTVPSPSVLSDKASPTDTPMKEEVVDNGETPQKDENDVKSSAGDVEQKGQSGTIQKTEDDSTAMDVDAPGELRDDSKIKHQDCEQSSSSLPQLTLMSLSETSSSSSSPSSIGLEEESPEIGSSSNGLLQPLERERREIKYNFQHVLPTLAIGSKEREAFYETIMDHLLKLKQEHRRLKEIVKNSDYTPKGRRATRSSPQYHSHRHHHHHLEEKPKKRNSPAPPKRDYPNGANSDGMGAGNVNGTNGSNKSNASSKVGSTTMTSSTTSGSSIPPYQGSTPSSAILTSNISATTRRSAATAAAAAVTAAVSRSSRGSYNTSHLEKKRANTASAAASVDNTESTVSTRAKRRAR